MSIENLKTFDPFAEADEDTGQVKQSQQDYIHIRIQRASPLSLYPNPFTLRLPCLLRFTCKPHTYTAILVSTPAHEAHSTPLPCTDSLISAQSAMAARP
jgi:hypothetical protein